MCSCPQCHLYLEILNWESTKIFACRGCGGIWFPLSSWETLLATDNNHLSELDLAFTSACNAEMYYGLNLPCPDCRNHNLSIDESSDPDLSPLICHNCHGVWLRAGDRSKYSRGGVNTVATDDLPINPLPPALEPTAVRLLESRPTTSQEALAALVEGNKRFVEGTSQQPCHSPELRRKLHEFGQTPFAVVVGCSDSRVPPEVVFDQGLGDMFVVRTAGGAFGEIAMAGIAYAINRFQAPLVVVVGHTGCSAVKAAIDGAPDDLYLATIVEMIRPAIEKAKEIPGDHYENSIRENAVRIARTIVGQAPVAALFAEQKVLIQAMLYHTDTGKIELLETPQRPLKDPSDFFSNTNSVQPDVPLVVTDPPFTDSNSDPAKSTKSMPKFWIKKD